MAVVYRHRKLGTNETFYIGISNSDNLKRPYTKHSRSQRWERMVNKYGYEVDIIFKNISYKEAKEAEILLINLYGRLDLKTGTLVNMTSGGDGSVGFKHSEESKKKMRLSQIGRIVSDETKEKLSIAGKNMSDERRNKISEAGKNRIVSDETREKLSKLKSGEKHHMYGKNHTEESKKQISDKLKGRISPLKGKKQTNEHIEKNRLKISRIILNLETGIFYYGAREAAESININPNTLRGYLNGRRKNKTSFILV